MSRLATKLALPRVNSWRAAGLAVPHELGGPLTLKRLDGLFPNGVDLRQFPGSTGLVPVDQRLSS